MDLAKEEQVLPVQRDDILNILQQVPDEILNGYLQVVETHIEELLLCKNVLSSRGKPNLFQHLIGGLDQTQLEKLSKITLNLAANDPVEKVRELTEETFNITIPTPDGFLKALALFDLIKSLDVDFEEEGKRLAVLSGHLRFFSDAVIVMNMGEKFEKLLLDRLTQVPENDLDHLIEIGNSQLVKNVSKN